MRARRHPGPLTGRALIAVLLLTGLTLSGCKKNNAYVAPPPVKVTVSHPQEQALTRYLETTGSTAAVDQVDLVARIAGFLQQINYKDGAAVHKGDTLFVIEPLPYQSKLQQAQAAEAQQQAQVTQADAEYTRQSTLGRSDFASQSNVEQALATRDAARQALIQAQAATQQAAINLTYTQITAPFDGVVSAHLVSVGQLVGMGETTKLTTIVKLNPINVDFTITEQDVQRIRADLGARGLTARDLNKVPVEIGLQTDSGYPHVGTLDYASPSVDQSTGTLAVRGVLANSDYALLPGYFVRVRVPVRRNVPTILVPDVAIGADQGGRYLLVVGADGTVGQRRVELGPLDGEQRAIDSGLTVQDSVIVNGIQRVVAGQKVEAVTQ